MDIAAFYLFSSFLLGSGTMVVLSKNAVHGVLYLIFAFFNAAGLFILLGAEFLAMILIVVYVGAVAVLFLFVVMMLEGETKTVNLLSIWQQMVITSRAFLKFLAYAVCLIALTWGSVELALFLTFSENARRWPTLILALGFFLLYSFSTKGLMKQSFFECSTNFLKVLPSSWILGGIILAEFSYLISRGFDVQKENLLTMAPVSQTVDNTHALGRIIYTDYILLFQVAALILLTAMIGAIVLTYRKSEGIKRQIVKDQINRRKEDTLTLHDRPLGEGV